MRHRVDLVWTDVSEEQIGSIFSVENPRARKQREQVAASSSIEDFSTLKMEVIRSSETSVHTRSTRRHIPEDGILQHIGYLRFELLTAVFMKSFIIWDIMPWSQLEADRRFGDICFYLHGRIRSQEGNQHEWGSNHSRRILWLLPARDYRHRSQRYNSDIYFSNVMRIFLSTSTYYSR
jgi:hypothetical protein